jgi:pyruvate dehydrogenase E2 component (dihydrolipoamide acetyltransferase)
MPKFEMAQETGTVSKWLKQEGETVAKDEPILEVETDKINMEVESPASGVLVGVQAGPGAVVPIGQPIAYIIKPGETWSPPSAGEGQNPL